METVLNAINGVGAVMAGSLVDFFHEPANRDAIDRLVAELDIQDVSERAPMLYRSSTYRRAR